MINQPPESRFAASLKPFFDTIDPLQNSRSCWNIIGPVGRDQ